MDGVDAAVLRANSRRATRFARHGLSRGRMTDLRRDAPRVLFLFTEVCADGGIQRFNRTILDSCGQLGVRCRVLSLNDSPASTSRHIEYARVPVVGFSGNRRRFALAVAGALLRGRYDRVLIGHINFLLLAVAVLMLRPLNRAPIILVAHGIEVWSGIGKLRTLALSRINRILCVSRYTRQRILEQAPGLIAERLVRFPNALADTWRSVAPALSADARPAFFILS